MKIDLELATSDELAEQINRIGQSIFELVPILNEINRRHKTDSRPGCRSRTLLERIMKAEDSLDQLILSLQSQLASDRIGGDQRPNN